MYKTERVKATRTFKVGPFHQTVISQGEERDVQIDNKGNFWTTTKEGRAFGTCNIDDGWTRIKGENSNA